MAKVTIDNLEYDTEDMSQETRATLVSLQYVDQKLQKLATKRAILQTARNTYARALRAHIGGQGIDEDSEETNIEGIGDTISFD